MKKVGIAILGLGVVGGGTYEILTQKREFFRETQNVDLVVERVLESNPNRIAALGIAKGCVAANIAEVALDPDVNIVVECIGGIEAAKEYVLAALNAGKTVVTSNKELFSKYSHELERAAKRHNAGLYFEASCVGGVPIIRTLLDGVQSNEISSLMGIINGTTNFILTEMTEKKTSYEEALKEAQRLGYAEANPAADVEGFDAAYKLSILSSLAFHTKVPFTKVFREGITNVSAEDIADGDALGYKLKLLAVGKNSQKGIEVRVHPTFVRKDHPLASVKGSYNAVFVTGDSVGDIMLYGRGAGALPTGSAIVSDIIYAATHSENKYSTFKNTASATEGVKFLNDFASGYYLRLTVNDEPGVLAKIAAILARYSISIVELIQRSSEKEAGKATLVLVTHETRELSVKNAVAKLNATELAKVESVLRVAL
ncbi:MAG: homoserine dehydrogenase [Clostridia bacterium]|nr:homoserine dehydrogenase [Clostridia bacterium]